MLTTPSFTTTGLPDDSNIQSSEAHSAPPLEWHDEPFPILILKPEDLKGGPHIGKAFRIPWYQGLAKLLWWEGSKEGDATLDPNDAKAARGGWVGGAYRGNHRKVSAFIETRLLVIDIDRNGDLETVKEPLAPYVFLAHTTYKSTPAAPRCRVVLLLDRPCTDARQYKAAHKAMVDRMIAWGYVEGDIDRGASDVSRLNYLPMHQSGVKPKILLGNGGDTRLNIEKLLAAVPATPKKDTPRSNPQEGPSDAYKEGALRRARERLASAGDGERHNTLYREAAGLARPGLGLSDAEIERALLPEYSHDERDGERTIRDAIAAGRSGT